MQLGEQGRARDPSPQQINVDKNYKMGLVIDCSLSSLFSFSSLFMFPPASTFPLWHSIPEFSIIAVSVLFVSAALISFDS